jgi:hypothetical protein
MSIAVKPTSQSGYMALFVSLVILAVMVSVDDDDDDDDAPSDDSSPMMTQRCTSGRDSPGPQNPAAPGPPHANTKHRWA